MTHSLRSDSRLRIAALLFASLLAGCVYRINIQQGNFLDQAAVEQVKVGMTRSQVRYLLGTPLAADAFSRSRWDYLYYFKKGHTRATEARRVTVYFADDKVARLEKSGPVQGQPQHDTTQSGA
jgi:outer membrane protein assembly factor BamE